MSSFNYDDDDIELDENGLPIEDESEMSPAEKLERQMQLLDKNTNSLNQMMGLNPEEYDSYSEQSSPTTEEMEELEELMQQMEEGTNELNELNGANESNSGGRYGDGPPKQNKSVNADGGKTPQIGGKGGKAGNAATALEKIKNNGGNLSSDDMKGMAKEMAKEMAEKAAKEAAKKALTNNPYFWMIAAIVAVVIIVIILVIYAFSSAAAAAAAEYEERTNAEGLATNELITDEYFYGLRTAYIDDEALTDELQLSYKRYSIEILKMLDDHADIVLNITLPTEYDNSTAIDSNITNMSIGIGNIVANNAPVYNNVSFESLYPNIQYFGITASQSESINSFLSAYVTDNSVISADGVNVLDEITTISQSDNLKYMFNICEKVMIKDFVATADGINGLQPEKYVGSVYMPNQSISIKDLMFVINNQNNDKTTNVQLIQSTKTNSDHWEEIISSFTTPNTNSDGNVTLIDDINQDFELSIFSNFETLSPEKYSQGVSLFDAVRLSSYKCFKSSTILDITIYTWKPNCSALFWEFETIDDFIFGEFDAIISASN